MCLGRLARFSFGSRVKIGLALLASLGVTFAQRESIDNSRISPLDQFHWNSERSGTLIGLDLPGLADKVQLVKVGSSSFLVPINTLVWSDEDLPNPYDLLSDEDKIDFLLSTLGQEDLQKIVGPGLCADDLKGQSRAAVLSLISQPFTYLSGHVEGLNGFESNGDLLTLPTDQCSKVKVKLERGLVVDYGYEGDGAGTTSWSSFSSLDNRGPDKSPAVQSEGFGFGGFRSIIGHDVPNLETKSALNLADTRLNASLKLSQKLDVGQAVELIRSATNIEIYVDERVRKFPIVHLGDQVSARDLLRGLCWSVCGTVRKVGTLYFLTSNLEGEAARDARINARRSIQARNIDPEVQKWRREVSRRNLRDRVNFAVNDPLQGGSIPVSLLGRQGPGEDDASWIPISSLPSSIQAAISNQRAQEASQEKEMRDQGIGAQPAANANLKPIPEFKDKVKLSSEIGYRLLLPDGRPLEVHKLNGTQVPEFLSSPGSFKDFLPMDFAKMPKGSAIQIRTESPETVAMAVKDLITRGVPELWLETHNPDALNVAVHSGLKVDLVLRPWDLASEETGRMADRDVLGLTRPQVDQALLEEEGRSSVDSARSPRFATINLSDPEIQAHINQLLSLIPAKGLNGLIVLDQELPGYTEEKDDGEAVNSATDINGWPIEIDPKLAVFDLGYSIQRRCEFIRDHHLDPLDLLPPNVARFTPVAPFIMSKFGFPEDELKLSAGCRTWRSEQHERSQKVSMAFLDKLRLYRLPIYHDIPGLPPELNVVGLDGNVSLEKPEVGSLISIQSLNPAEIEDADGHPKFSPNAPPGASLCFDLSQAFDRDLPRCLRLLCKVVSPSQSVHN